jgi:hypothetical protein
VKVGKHKQKLKEGIMSDYLWFEFGKKLEDMGESGCLLHFIIDYMFDLLLNRHQRFFS